MVRGRGAEPTVSKVTRQWRRQEEERVANSRRRCEGGDSETHSELSIQDVHTLPGPNNYPTTMTRRFRPPLNLFMSWNARLYCSLLQTCSLNLNRCPPPRRVSCGSSSGMMRKTIYQPLRPRCRIRMSFFFYQPPRIGDVKRPQPRPPVFGSSLPFSDRNGSSIKNRSGAERITEPYLGGQLAVTATAAIRDFRNYGRQ